MIELDKDTYGPDNHLAEWHRTSSGQNDLDGFTVSLWCRTPSHAHTHFTTCHIHRTAQVSRPGEETVKCTILLTLNYQVCGNDAYICIY